MAEFLRRYTDLPCVIYLLRERKLTLLDPASWDDGNDSHYLALYRERRRLQSVLALCFTQAGETYHHWRVFAPGPGGVCVQFKRASVLRAVRGPHVRSEAVRYLKLEMLRGRRLRSRELPFIKRQAFEHENEFRVIYESRKTRLSKLDLNLSLKAIASITLSPWMHPDLAAHVKETIASIEGCSGLRLSRSTLIGNDEWKRLGENSR